MYLVSTQRMLFRCCILTHFLFLSISISFNFYFIASFDLMLPRDGIKGEKESCSPEWCGWINADFRADKVPLVFDISLILPQILSHFSKLRSVQVRSLPAYSM